jgi:hypothetical protein
MTELRFGSSLPEVQKEKAQYFLDYYLQRAEGNAQYFRELLEMEGYSLPTSIVTECPWHAYYIYTVSGGCAHSTGAITCSKSLLNSSTQSSEANRINLKRIAEYLEVLTLANIALRGKDYWAKTLALAVQAGFYPDDPCCLIRQTMLNRRIYDEKLKLKFSTDFMGKNLTLLKTSKLLPTEIELFKLGVNPYYKMNKNGTWYKMLTLTDVINTNTAISELKSEVAEIKALLQKLSDK